MEIIWLSSSKELRLIAFQYFVVLSYTIVLQYSSL